nr:hypothetical protein CFP56_50673 [Quercus suber]
MAAQFHGVQPQSSASVREGEGGSMVVQPAEGMTEGGDDDVALKTIDGETLQTVEGNKEGEGQEINCVEVADTLQPIQGIQQLLDSLLPPINAPNNEGVIFESEFSVPNSVSEVDLFDLQIRGNDEALNMYEENAEIKGIKFDVINSHSISPVNQTVSDERERASQAGSRATQGKQYGQLNAGNDDNSPIIAPINSNSQQFQRQVFNMVNIPKQGKKRNNNNEG